MTCSFDIENKLLNKEYSFICGIDEVGRGSLFGPVVSGAVILDPEKINPEVNDSKQITHKKRVVLAEDIYKNALDFAIGWCWNDKIDSVNILNATKISMRMAFLNLHIEPDYVLMDSINPDFLNVKGEGVIKGDSISISIAAASIIAKVFRDGLMRQFAEYFTGYDLEKNKGYPTKDHISTLKKGGITLFHRKSFKIKNG